MTGGDRSDKQALREEFLQSRRARDADAVAAARAAVRSGLLARWDETPWRSVAAYVPLRTEPGSTELLAELVRRGVRVLVPVTLPDRDLDWVELPGDVPRGIGAIAAVEAVLVPALSVAHDGTRLGRGGGSYDRALTRVAAGVPIAALLFDGEVQAWLPSEPWDVPVTAYVTPATGWVSIESLPTGRGNP